MAFRGYFSEVIPLFPELRIREERRAHRVPGADVHLDADGGLQLAHGEAESGGALGRKVRATCASGMPSRIVFNIHDQSGPSGFRTENLCSVVFDTEGHTAG